MTLAVEVWYDSKRAKKDVPLLYICHSRPIPRAWRGAARVRERGLE